MIQRNLYQFVTTFTTGKTDETDKAQGGSLCKEAKLP